MADSSLERRFIGQARLSRLLLWKVGDTTDIDACLNVAKDDGMLSEDDASFLLECMSAEETARDSESSDLGIEVDGEMINRLQRCVDKLNRADCA